jgi:hypothetical protein
LLASLAAVGIGLASQSAAAADARVPVTLPAFTVTLNGNQVENEYREYPLFVYKDITYVPMTWFDSRLLGLETEWTPEAGLSIAKGNVTASYAPYKTERKQASRFQAEVLDSKITINGNTIDNATEEYPLLSYRNVVYFPLTWRFAHDEFGWDYQWDPARGLSIASSNPQVETIALPPKAGETSVAFFKGHYYFAEKSENLHEIYRVSENSLEGKELVYSYEWSSPYLSNPSVNFWVENEELWFSYHLGGAIMGRDEYVRIGEDGKGVREFSGYLDFTSSPDGTITVYQGVPPSGDNLLWKPTGQEARQAGAPGYIYGWFAERYEDGTAGFSADKSAVIAGDSVYVLASKFPIGSGEKNRIYKIGLGTNEMTKIADSEAVRFSIIGDRLYFVKEEDRRLYETDLDGNDERQVTDRPVAGWFGRIGGNLYYMAADADGNQRLYKAVPSEEDVAVLEDSAANVQIAGERMIVKLQAGGDYGMRVLDSTGQSLLNITDQASYMFAYDDVILFVPEGGQSVRQIRLPENEEMKGEY